MVNTTATILDRLVTDWGVRAPDGTTIVCDGRETAAELRAELPHLTVVCKWPSGRWLTPVEAASAIRSAVEEFEEQWTGEEAECEGHESLRGDFMGESYYCDGSCRR